jgi:hypothetical protein
MCFIVKFFRRIKLSFYIFLNIRILSPAMKLFFIMLSHLSRFLSTFVILYVLPPNSRWSFTLSIQV